jgi:hypothetical protein
LGIFGTIDTPNVKMVFSFESTRHRFRCDLLLPIDDRSPAPCLRKIPQRRNAKSIVGQTRLRAEA